MPDSGVITHAPNLAEALAAGTVALTPDALRDRSRGALLGQAAGNLLGLPEEGQWHYDIKCWYPHGLTEIDPDEAHRPMDDDLAQAVELAESLLAGGDLATVFADHMIRWYQENGRGCGSTTRAAISNLMDGIAPPVAARMVYSERNRVAPNGGVMRCAPVAIARRREPAQLVSDSAVSCAVTHYAPACQWACIVINAVIARLLAGAAPDLGGVMAAATADGCPNLAAMAGDDGIPTDILDAVAAGRSVPPGIDWLLCDHHIIAHTLLAMQAGLWAAVTPLGFEDALVAMVSAGGDADTNAAVAGAVLGARYGASAIPQRWQNCIPQRERITGLADSLAGMAGN